ncbi:YigZ family protein [Motiliproteus sp. MSK22-1]|nr:YigZ family protein [Motiliproteus sp. MSK22-1]
MIEYEIKKSRFIAWACPAGDRATAMSVLDEARAEYPDARHHCWAYLIGPPHSPKTVAMSDDGEPSGTAGKPILNVLQHKDIGNVMLVVIRYFGGIKLGAGGLVRAYSHAAQLAMVQLSTKQHVQMISVEIRCNFSREQDIRHWLTTHQGSVNEVSYETAVIIQAAIPAKHQAELTRFTDNLQIQLKTR